jgi:hypothetical protein
MNLTRFETESTLLSIIERQFIQNMRLFNELYSDLLGLAGSSNAFGQRIKHVGRRVKREIPFFSDHIVNSLGYDRVDRLIKVRRSEIALDKHLNVNWDFVNHNLENNKWFVSSFRKGLFRGLTRRPDVAHVSRDNEQKE